MVWDLGLRVGLEFKSEGFGVMILGYLTRVPLLTSSGQTSLPFLLAPGA